MDKPRVLRELATLESHLKRCNVPYFTVVGHYRRWLATATPEEELIVVNRINSLFVGVDNLNDLYISKELEHDVSDENSANKVLNHLRLSLIDALNIIPETSIKIPLTPPTTEIGVAPTSKKSYNRIVIINLILLWFLVCLFVGWSLGMIFHR